MGPKLLGTVGHSHTFGGQRYVSLPPESQEEVQL